MNDTSGGAATVRRLIPLTCGWMTLPTAFFLEGEPGRITFPVPAYLIDHPDGLALFDAGLGPRFARAAGTPAPARIDLEQEGMIDGRLREIGIEPAAVRYIVNSHLHTDHAGGNILVPNASIIIQTPEWAAAHDSGDRAYHPPEFDTGQPVVMIDGEHDLFGDGSVLLFPTPGHTPGHQSARVRTAGGDVVLTGDACNLRRSLDELRVPDHAHDLDEYLVSLKKLRRLRDEGAMVSYGHDPDYWRTLEPGSPLTFS